MILSLAILRGVHLAAMDNNIIAANSSDPYCEVYVNGAKIGWTPTRSRTLNPVWGGQSSTFKFRGGGGTEIQIKIIDRDELKPDDPMGQVTLHASDLLSRLDKTGYPNFWATVEPPEGYTEYVGKLQFRLLEVSETADESSQRVPPPQSPGMLVAGPELFNVSIRHIREMVASAKAPVMLHVYDVGDSSKVKTINDYLPVTGMGGIFHGGIELYGKEYSFGFSSSPVCGIFANKAAACPVHTFRESIYLGDCGLSRKQADAILRKLKPEWQANTYDLLRKNCVLFSNELAIELGVGGIPEWLYSLADIATSVQEMMGKKSCKKEEIGHYVSMRKTWRSVEVEKANSGSMEDLTMVTVMAIRLQRLFRARSDLRQMGAASSSTQVRRSTANVYGGVGFEITDPDIHREEKEENPSMAQGRRATANVYSVMGFEIADPDVHREEKEDDPSMT